MREKKIHVNSYILNKTIFYISHVFRYCIVFRLYGVFMKKLSPKVSRVDFGKIAENEKINERFNSVQKVGSFSLNSHTT